MTNNFISLQDRIDQIIDILSTKIRDRGTGHIHTAIRVLHESVYEEEYEE